MTNRIFNEDAYIFDFDAAVVSCVNNGDIYETVLDRTAFFPEGGGQKGDRGTIDDANVLDTVEKNGEIIHICNAPVEGAVSCSLDRDFRFNNMQGHSGEHIFSGIAHSLYGCENVGFHMGDGYITVDFDIKLDAQQIKTVERLANEAIWKNYDIRVSYPSDKEAETIEYRSKKEILNGLRIVEVENTDICACCGTHVRKTGEIGIIKVGSFQNYKGGVRITLYIGADGLADCVMKNDNLLHIANELSAKPNETAECYDRYVQSVSQLKLEYSNLKSRYFDLLAKSYDGADYAFICENGLDAGETGKLCAALGKYARTAVVISGTDGAYKYAICSENDLREKCKALNARLNGRGGGKPNFVQGSFACDRQTAECCAERILNNK